MGARKGGTVTVPLDGEVDTTGPGLDGLDWATSSPMWGSLGNPRNAT